MLDLDLRIREVVNERLPYFESAEAAQVLSAAFRPESPQPPGSLPLGSSDAHEAGIPSATPSAKGVEFPIRVQNMRAAPILPELALAATVERGARLAIGGSSGVPPPWLVGMSPSFYKDIDAIDKKLQGRILEAIADISKRPLQSLGDTIKPLSGKYKYCWRYRIGDYRLVFMPDVSRASITLLAFAPRGSIYTD